MYLFSLKIDDGVLSSVFEEVFVGGDAVVGQDLGETVGATGVHQVGQELKIWNFILVFKYLNSIIERFKLTYKW